MVNETLLTRRQFLNQATVVAGVILTAPLLQYRKAIAAPIATLYEIPATQIQMLPVLEWLGSFATQIAASVLPTLLLDWVGEGNDATRNTASKAVKDIDDRGFTENDDSRVYNQNYNYFYGATDSGYFQALTPFQYSPWDYTVLGGPAVIGLNGLQDRLVQRNRYMSRSQLAPYVLPSGDVDLPCYCFSFDASWQASYPTRQGYVKMDYTKISSPYTNLQGQLMPGQGYLTSYSHKTEDQLYAGVGQTITYA